MHPMRHPFFFLVDLGAACCVLCEFRVNPQEGQEFALSEMSFPHSGHLIMLIFHLLGMNVDFNRLICYSTIPNQKGVESLKRLPNFETRQSLYNR